MNFIRKKLSGGFRKAEHHGKRHLYRRPYLLPIFGLVLGAAVVLIVVVAHGGQTLSSVNSHVVFLFDGTKKQTLDTRSATVGELISKLKLNLIPQDVIEPSQNTPILEDNFRINVYRARPVVVIDSGIRKMTLTAQKSPRVVAQKAGIKVYPEDNVSFAQGSLKENIIGEKVVIDRAVPVALNLYGVSHIVRTHAKTVGELLAEKQVKLLKSDTLQPKSTTPITPNLQVFVLRKGIKIVSVTQNIPIPTESVSDPSLTHGTTAVRQEGTPGQEVVTYEIKLQNGIEVSRKAIQRVITTKPVPRIIAVGSAAFSGSLQDWLYKLRMCESGGNYQTNSGNGYYGAYQFSIGTWNSLNTGYARADLAPPAVQDQAIIANTLRSSGLTSQNPGCYYSQGLSNYPPSNR